MASLQATPSGYVISFRYDGIKFNRSLKTTDEEKAQRLKAGIEETIDLISRGKLTPPQGATPSEFWNYVRSDGKQTGIPSLAKTITHDSVWQEYFASIPEGSKEPSSLNTERTHSKHYLSYFGKSKPFDQVATSKNLTAYVKKRQRDAGRYGSNLSAGTLERELQTFRQLWTFAEKEGYVRGTNPVADVLAPRLDEKEPFRTYDEITAVIERGGLNDHQVAQLWEGLFLRENEIEEVLKHVKSYAEKNPLERFVYPMVAFHAFTTVRRSEMLRSQCDDLNGRVLLREKKRSRTKRITLRQVEIHPRLETIMKDWFASHPGGQYTISKANGTPLTGDEAHRSLKRALHGTRWTCIRGFHVFRHSFASNAARRGIDPNIIDRWMGHQTQEMRQRYLHLFPEDMQTAIEAMYSA